MTRVRITEVSISGTPFPIQAFDMDVDREELFLEVRRQDGELHQRIKVDIKEAVAKGRMEKRIVPVPKKCAVCGYSEHSGRCGEQSGSGPEDGYA